MRGPETGKQGHDQPPDVLGLFWVGRVGVMRLCCFPVASQGPGHTSQTSAEPDARGPPCLAAQQPTHSAPAPTGSPK